MSEKREDGEGAGETEIKRQVPNPHPGITLATLHIPHRSRPGTGTFTLAFKARALLTNEPAGAFIGNVALNLHIAATVNPALEVGVLFGKADGSQLQQRVFRLPRGFDLREPHVLVIHFGGWWVSHATFSGHPVEIVT